MLSLSSASSLMKVTLPGNFEMRDLRAGDSLREDAKMVLTCEEGRAASWVVNSRPRPREVPVMR